MASLMELKALEGYRALNWARQLLKVCWKNILGVGLYSSVWLSLITQKYLE